MSKGKGKDVLIDSHVSLRQCKLAVEALHSHSAKKEQKAAETELLPGKEQHLWLQVAVKKMQPEKKIKPFKIPIVHSLVDPRTSSICLITKDPQREYKDLIESNGIKFISRVISITKLKGKFKPFEARRMLLKENGMFLADDRVVPLLPGILGSKWFEAKKQPIPVCLTRKDLKGELERAISSTYMHQNQGTCTSIKIATTAQSVAQALANLQKALPAIIEKLKGGWENVQSLHLKTSESVALPIWTCGLGPGGEESRWNGLVAGEESGGDDEDEMDIDHTAVESKERAKAKGTKRPSDEDVQPEISKKKAKVRKSSPPIAAEIDVPKKKRKSQIEIPDLPVPAEPFPTDVEAEADIDTDGIDAIPSDSAPAKASAAADDVPIWHKKKKHLKEQEALTAADAAIEADADAAPSQSTAIAVPLVEGGSGRNKKQKKVKTTVAEELKVDATSSSAEPIVTRIPVIAEDSSTKRLRKGKKARLSLADPNSDPPAAAVSIAITKDELKQKRSGESGERKKDKVVKKSRKSAKDDLLGRKAGQS